MSVQKLILQANLKNLMLAITVVATYKQVQKARGKAENAFYKHRTEALERCIYAYSYAMSQIETDIKFHGIKISDYIH